MERLFWLLSTLFKIPLLMVLFLIYFPINILDVLWLKIIGEKPQYSVVDGSL